MGPHNLRTALKHPLWTETAEEQIAAAKAWLAERRALLVLDNIWENDVTRSCRSAGLVAMHVAPAFAAVDFAGSFAGRAGVRILVAGHESKKSLDIYQHLSLGAVEHAYHEAVQGVSI